MKLRGIYASADCVMGAEFSVSGEDIRRQYESRSIAFCYLDELFRDRGDEVKESFIFVGMCGHSKAG